MASGEGEGFHSAHGHIFLINVLSVWKIKRILICMDAMSTNPEKFSLDKKSWRGLQF